MCASVSQTDAAVMITSMPRINHPHKRPKKTCFSNNNNQKKTHTHHQAVPCMRIKSMRNIIARAQPHTHARQIGRFYIAHTHTHTHQRARTHARASSIEPHRERAKCVKEFFAGRPKKVIDLCECRPARKHAARKTEQIARRTESHHVAMSVILLAGRSAPLAKCHRATEPNRKLRIRNRIIAHERSFV